MDFRTLRAFVEVVRHGGFSRAAEMMNSTQSAVSKAVRQLEDEVGLQLLDRIGHRTRLTAAGEVMFARGQALLAGRDDLMTEMQEIAGMRQGVLRLGLPPIGPSVLFAPLFTSYRKLYPGIEIRLTEHGSDRLEELLRAGEIDCGASLLPVAEDFDWQPVRRETLVALVEAGHPLASRESLTIPDIAAEPLILFESGFALNRVIRDAYDRRGLVPHVAARSSQIDFIVSLAAAGLGIGFLPPLIAARHAHPGVRLVPFVEARTAWDLAVIWRRGAYLSRAAQAWLRLVEAAYPGPSARAG